MPSFLIDHKELRELAAGTFAATGSTAAEAAIISNHLVDANLAGHDSHGIGLLPMYVRDRKANMVKANRHAVRENADGAIGAFTGAMGYGQVVVGEAMAWGIARAAADGMAFVTVRESYHVGRVGAYAEQAATGGILSIIFVNVVGGPPLMAPFGGVDGRLQTNPIAIGVPGSGGRPEMVLDFATSRVPVGKLRVASAEGRKAPAASLIDAKGAPSDDPAVLFADPRGYLVPFGEHKGSGLAIACEILAGVMSRSRSNTQTAATDRMTNGFFAILLDPSRFAAADFHAEVAAILDHVRASPAAVKGVPVMVPGDPERKARAVRLEMGVPVDENTWRLVKEAAASAAS